MCKHDVARQLANGRTFGVQNRRIRLTDTMLCRAVQPVPVAAPFVPGTPAWNAAVAADFAN